MLKQSELILNSDQSIYHLHLHAEQLADTIILVGDPERVPKVSRYFDKIDFKIRKREFVTHTGSLGKKQISVISTGIGTDNIDIVLNEIDALANVDLRTKIVKNDQKTLDFIRIGTSGSIRSEIPVDSFLISTGAFGLDSLLHFYDATELLENDFTDAFKKQCLDRFGFPNKPYFAAANSNLLVHFEPNFLKGITATNAGFYAPQGRQLRVNIQKGDFFAALNAFDFNKHQITNLEMETAGIYGLAQIMGHRAVSLNAILANRASGQFSKKPEKTIHRLIELAIERISLI